MSRLADLWRSVVPGAEAFGPVDAADGPIGWVRVLKPRVPAFDALEPGDLAIVPTAALAVVAPGPEEIGELVAALVRARVAGVVIVRPEPPAESSLQAADVPAEGRGVTRDVDVDAAAEPSAPAGRSASASAERSAPAGPSASASAERSPSARAESPTTDLADSLAGALAAAGLPSLAATGDGVTLERRAIGFLVNRRAELDRQAADLERQIERLALAGRGVEALAAAIGTFLGRAVVIERRRGEPLAIHAPADRPSLAGAVARYHVRPSGASLRLPLPGADGRPVGALVLLGDEPVAERERVAVERIATLLALELARSSTVGQAPVGRPEALPSAGPPWAVVVARQRIGPDDAGPPDRLERMRREVRLLGGPNRLVLRGDATSLELRAVVAIGRDDPSGHELAGRIAATVGRTVALSRSFDAAADRPVAEAEARSTLEAVERLAEAPAVARADLLPAYRLLGSLPDLPDGLRQARALLAPLLVGDPAGRRLRLETLRAVLDREAGADAAAVLGVHRNTVAYRLRAIERLGGWDLGDPELRFALAVALRLVQSAQADVTEP